MKKLCYLRITEKNSANFIGHLTQTSLLNGLEHIDNL
jgi:hypothetical protein